MWCDVMKSWKFEVVGDELNTAYDMFVDSEKQKMRWAENK